MYKPSWVGIFIPVRPKKNLFRSQIRRRTSKFFAREMSQRKEFRETRSEREKRFRPDLFHSFFFSGKRGKRPFWKRNDTISVVLSGLIAWRDNSVLFSVCVLPLGGQACIKIQEDERDRRFDYALWYFQNTKACKLDCDLGTRGLELLCTCVCVTGEFGPI